MSTRTGREHESAAAIWEGTDRWIVARFDAGRAVLETLPAGDVEALGRTLAAWGSGVLLRFAPAGSTVTKLTNVPSGTDEAVEAAVRLLGEGELPAGIPEHRRAGGIVDGAASRHVLLTGWLPGEAPKELIKGVDERWTTMPAVLAALHSGGPGLSLHAASDGTIVVFATGELGTRLRVLREERGDETAWRALLLETARSAARFAGVDAPAQLHPTMHIDAGVAASLSLRHGIEGEEVRAAAPVIGALLLASTPLASLRAVAPRDEAPVLLRGAKWLSRPTHAWLAGAACIVLATVAPLGLAHLRLVVLESKSRGIDQSSEREIRRQAALYRQVSQSRWPMTKLLADIAAATPVGVVVDNLRLSKEQGLSVQGNADSIDHVNRLQQNLNRTGLFASVRIERVESSANGVTFDLGAAVLQPYREVTGAEDFAAEPLAVRLYGEAARHAPATTLSSGSDRGSSGLRGSAPSSRTERGGAVEGDRRTVGPSEARSSPSTASSEVPPELSDDDIAKMDEATARSEWVRRRTYPQRNPAIDQATKDRLAEDARRLQAHRAKLGGGS